MRFDRGYRGDLIHYRSFDGHVKGLYTENFYLMYFMKQVTVRSSIS